MTGGASGIGAAVVEALHRQGARTAFLDMDRAAAARLQDALGPNAPAFIPCDLRDVDALRAALRRASDHVGPIRVLVNNAARDDRHAVADVTPELWDELQHVNLRHQFFAAQAVMDEMAGAGGGAIVNLGSIAWLIGERGMPVYLTAKAGVNGLTRALARDLGPRNIRVNAVLPGWTMTARQLALWVTPDAEREIERRQCIKRKLMPADVANMVLFLASDDSAMCTSQAYIVDGGWA